MDSFKKCDLHMHSSSCYSRGYDKTSFINKLKNEPLLDVISITDHNVVDVSLYKELKKEIPELYLIGGVELNIAIDEEIVNKHSLYVQNNYFHGIVWFSYADIDIFWVQLKKLLESKNIEVDEADIKTTSKRTEGIYFELSSIQNIFKNIDYYLVFHECKSDRNLSDYLPNTKDGEAYDPNIKYKHNLFYYNNKYAIEGGKKTRVISNYFENQLNTLLARFFFSDAIELKDIGTKFSWINFDGEFESLVLPLSDPESRIFTSYDKSVNPQSNRENYLEEIKITMKNSKDKTSKETILTFSPSLNGIIGSRGSGKSLLGSVLGNKNVDNYNNYVDHSSTLYKVKGKKYQNNSPKSKYLSQNSLLNIYNDGDVKEIDFIKELCSQMEDDISKQTASFIAKSKKMLLKEKNLIDTMDISKIFNLDDISFLEKSVNDEFMIPTLKRDDFEDNKERIRKFSENNVTLISNLMSTLINVKKIEHPKIKYVEMNEFDDIVDDFKATFADMATQLIDYVEETNTKISELSLENIHVREKLIEELISKIEFGNKKSDSEAQDFVTSRSNAINQLNKITSFRTFIQESYDYIENLTEELKNEKSSGEITVNTTDKLIISTSIEDSNSYCDTISTQLKIQNSEKYNEYMVKILLSYNEIDKLRAHFNGNKYKPTSLKSSSQYLNKYFSNVEQSINSVNEFIFKLYFNGKELNNYSPGKKSEILLDIFLDKAILSQEYLYIILDQPEDNMDTKTITDKLINRIRQLKLDIQLFVISHSAAVIINGDSDNLIFASENDNTLSYSSGRIIDASMKKSIVDTLDGGEKNLKMRLTKYDFKLKETVND
ncbi:hypothetical protein AOC36_08520 [Erysipelothrix larvae]|uniref:Polymerase/histidinol phosphatase N-terminal domain-containing protein n=1 Tax=Erysipelothrix larvae TaxID=1514105 RepID=A0A0X8H0X1_9FIRM|nr:PHP domain-containing protein [Erysipelothrix larvae]AMC94028.1 hypothetical protein AOC36_08520 [Erysipelothrix larvae]